MKHRVTFYFILLSVFASFLNYATYPLLARFLPDSQFVEMTVALSLLTQVMTLLSSIVAISTGLVKENPSTSNETIEKLQSVLVYLLLFVLAVFIVTSPFTLTTLRINFLYLLPIALQLIFAIPISILSGFFNGRKELVKLGLVAAISACIQFGASVATGYLTGNGALALIGMATGQLLSILLLYFLFRKNRPPHIKTIFSHTTKDLADVRIRKLVVYTIFASLAVMAVNVLQIADLLAVQYFQRDEKLYTDIYIISRVVFFAGTIFMWPFISSVELENKKITFRYFSKFLGIVALLTFCAIIGVVLFGSHIPSILFGTTYNNQTFITLANLSILYKFFSLVFFALVLQLIVLRNYAAVGITAVSSIIALVCLGIAPDTISTKALLVLLNSIAFLSCCACLIFLYKPKSS